MATVTSVLYKNVSVDFKQAETKYIVFTGSVPQKYVFVTVYFPSFMSHLSDTLNSSVCQ